jgi:hypothetical protein
MVATMSSLRIVLSFPSAPLVLTFIVLVSSAPGMAGLAHGSCRHEFLPAPSGVRKLSRVDA